MHHPLYTCVPILQMFRKYYKSLNAFKLTIAAPLSFLTFLLFLSFFLPLFLPCLPPSLLFFLSHPFLPSKSFFLPSLLSIPFHFPSFHSCFLSFPAFCADHLTLLSHLSFTSLNSLLLSLSPHSARILSFLFLLPFDFPSHRSLPSSLFPSLPLLFVFPCAPRANFTS